MKVPCLAVIYHDPYIVHTFLDFIGKWSDRLDVSLAENPSENTPEFKLKIDALMKDGKIKNHFLFHRNIRNNVFESVLASGKFPMNHKYVLFTDGDVTTEDDFLSEQTAIMDKCPEAFVCSVDLEMSNLPTHTFPESVGWVPPLLSENEFYKEGYGGHHLLMMRRDELAPFMSYKETRKWTWTDGSLRQYAYANGKKWAKTKYSKARHLTWDVYANRNHPYTKLKTSSTPTELWDVAETAGYELTGIST